MNKLYIYIIVCCQLFILSCETDDNHNKRKIDFLIENIDTLSFDSIYGFSTYSRGYDMLENKYLCEIIYIDSLNTRYTIPSFQYIKDKSEISLSKYDFIGFGRCFNKKEQDGINHARLISKKLINIITRYKMYGISSPRNVDKIIGFEISEGLIVYYTLNINLLSGELRNSIKNAYSIKPNWFLPNHNQQAAKIIDNYIKDRRNI